MIIDLEKARERLNAPVQVHPIQQALDALALALTSHGHIWTDDEVQQYETATSYLLSDCKVTD